MEEIRACLRIKGIVQGVGFRPFVYGLAMQHKLNGWVLNDNKGVHIEVEGQRDRVCDFISGLSSPPPLARIEKTAIEYSTPHGYRKFEIKNSREGKKKSALISPDISVCNDCLVELFNPGDRRFRYPFINCTNCGPRFTIIQGQGIPYDRQNTTMSAFKLCTRCDAEYKDPANRRFHAQPNACRDCGPALVLLDNSGKTISHCDPVEGAIDFLKNGKILAIKGLGGFHLACDASLEQAVFALRERKFREDKPFALMCKDTRVVERICRLDELSRDILESKEKPIVVLPRRKHTSIAPSAAPFQKTLGVMLPYTPLHFLLFDHGVETLVMTSGNVSDEPIAYKDREAFKRLGDIADYFLMHNREIHTRCDDSVIRNDGGGNAVFLRRSRGYAPSPLKLKRKGKSVLACGADLKNTFCITKDDFAFLSHHIGDMENFETLGSFEHGITLFKELFQINPEIVVHDLHPDYLSTRYALSMELPGLGVQHHFAHALSCMAENQMEGPVLAVVMDGTGYGDDGTIWGAEFLEVTSTSYSRLGHLKYLPLPGNDMAIREPWRMAAAYLERLYSKLEELDIPFVESIDLDKWHIIKSAMKAGINSPLCSSMGRLFDAVSALVGLRHEVNYEGQAATELEQIIQENGNSKYYFNIFNQSSVKIIDPDPVINSIVEDIKRNTPSPVISARFHNSVAGMICRMSTILRKECGLSDILLSGGVFQNTSLLARVLSNLKDQGFRVYTHKKLPPNDGGISLGQAFYAISLEED